MNTKRWSKTIAFVAASLLAVIVGISGCGPTMTSPPTTATAIPTSTLTSTPVPPTTIPTPLPTLSLDETSAKDFVIKDFDAVHAPVNDDANKYLIFGNIPVSKPAANLPPELAVFLGRWEGYNYAPSVKKDQKIVMVIQEITAQEGQAFGWVGINLQYPTYIQDLHFRV